VVKFCKGGDNVISFENVISLEGLLELIFTVALTLISVYFGLKTAGVNDKNDTAKQMVEKIYFPIFDLIEKDLYREITLDQAIDYGNKILDIIHQNPMYVYPSLKTYAHNLAQSVESNFSENFIRLCWSVEKHYDKYSKRVGLPLRSYAYRINNRQYEDRYQLFFYLLRLMFPQLLMYLAFSIILYYLIKL